MPSTEKAADLSLRLSFGGENIADMVWVACRGDEREKSRINFVYEVFLQ